MNDFPTLWMKDICTELNNAGLSMPKDKGGGQWDINKFENSIQFMKEHVTLDSGIYEYINAKGLINRGKCPITGESIGTEYLYQIFGRKVYIKKWTGNCKRMGQKGACQSFWERTNDTRTKTSSL